MNTKFDIGRTTERWNRIGLLNGIDDVSDKVVMSMFYEFTLRHLTFLSEEQKILDNMFENETVYFPMLRRLFNQNKLSPKYFLPQYEVQKYETYEFFLTLIRTLDERNSYEKEIENYVEEKMALNYRITLQDDMAFSIITFIPILISDYHQYVIDMKKDYDYMIMLMNCSDPESEFICNYCEKFDIKKLLNEWGKKKLKENITVIEFEKFLTANLAKNILSGSNEIMSTTPS